MKTLSSVLQIIFFANAVLLSDRILAQSPLPLTLRSPDKNLSFLLQVSDSGAQYAVMFKNKVLIGRSPFHLTFKEGGEFGKNLRLDRPVFKKVNESYSLVVGKCSRVNDTYEEARFPLEEKKSPYRKINLVVRAFNDGIAFRYEIPKQTAWSNYTLTDEYTAFRFTEKPSVLALFLPNYTTSHEGKYTAESFDEIREDSLMDMPALFEFSGGVHMAITEAALVDYAGMYLVKHEGIIASALSPLPGQKEMKVKAALPHNSPWRVMLIGDRIGTLIESNIITSLNEPSKIKDLSWLKPGKTTFPWWNGDVTPDTTFTPGMNFETQKYYIDFCAANKIDYHSVVSYGVHEWYVNDGPSFFPGPHVDAGKAISSIDMQKVCDYAKSKGVGIRIWVYWTALWQNVDAIFDQYEKWGIKGMMVDFMDRDDQEMVNIQETILKKAAAHKMHIQFHGAYKPTGLARTYPNELTREGSLNYENDKWGTRIDPDHDINFPFTRGLAGPTDYHLGGFRAVARNHFKVQYTRPLLLGTRCHMLAMYMVLESYLGMVCDYPNAYLGQPGFKFLQDVPTTWDETKVVDAKVSEFITIARRKGSDWYVGSMTNWTPRTVTVPLAFLSEGAYRAEIYRDAPDADINPNHLVTESKDVSKADVLTVDLAAGGGAVVHFIKKRP